VAFTCPSLVAGEDLDRVVASVNEDVITKSQVEQRMVEITTMLRAANRPAPPEPVLKREARRQLIDEALLLQRSEGAFRESAAERIAQREFDEYIEGLREEIGEKQIQARMAESNQTFSEFQTAYVTDRTRRILVRQASASWIDEFLMTPVSKSQVEKYLEEHPELKEKLVVQLVLIRVPADAAETVKDAKLRKAERILNKARAGEPFEDLVEVYSEDDRAKERKGVYELESPSVPFPEFAPVFEIREGQVYPELIRIPAGWCIVRVESRESLHNMTRRAIAEEEFQKALEELRNEATTVYDPDYF
jgi:peptidyl-prolyl cis-trans isomerase SurA